MHIPAQWDDVTPAWLTAVLADRFPGAQVATVTLLWQSEGSNRRARFALTYAGDSAPGPERVFVKAEGQFREVHAQNGNLFNESLLLASRVPLPLEHPEGYAALIDRPTSDWLIVMEDVAQRGADARDATRPMTVGQVTSGVRGLARLHREYWDLSVAVPALDWLQTWQRSEGFLGALRVRMAEGLRRLGAALPGELRTYDGDELVELCGRYMAVLSRDPVTLLHGDAHIGNTYVLPDGTVGFLDWQVARRGNWSQDVGYFVQGALTEQDRRDHERAILEDYFGELDCGLDAADAEVWYRAAPLYGLPVWLATLGAGAAQSVDVCTALCRRYAVAALDLDAVDAIRTLESAGVKPAV